MASLGPVLELVEVTRRFLGVVALDLFPGELHALVGENGAGKSTLLNIISGVLTPLTVFLVAAIFVHRTRRGRYLFAIGDDPTAARFAALPVKRLLWSIYAASGCVAGLVAVAYTSRSGAATPTSGVGRELEAIACVVLGGTRVTGGSGGIGRTRLGVIVLAHLDIALQLAGSFNRRLPGMESV